MAGRETSRTRAQEFDHILGILELEPKDNAHKLLMALINNKKRSITTILLKDKNNLRILSSPDTDRKSMNLDDWEVTEILNISRHASMKRAENEDFSLLDMDASVFENWKLSPAYTQYQHAVGDMTATLPFITSEGDDSCTESDLPLSSALYDDLGTSTSK